MCSATSSRCFIGEYPQALRPVIEESGVLMVGYRDRDVARILHLLREENFGEEPSLEPFTSRSLAARLGRILDEACS